MKRVPINRLVTVGDSLIQGFMSGAIFRTDLSWPAVVAYELGLRVGTDFRYPVYEPPSGPGGLPSVSSGSYAGSSSASAIEDYWERDRGQRVPATRAPYHNLGVYGSDLLDALLLDGDIVAERLREPADDDLFDQLVEHDNDLAWRTVLESCRSADGAAQTVLQGARALGTDGVVGGGDGPGIETLVVMLGSNHALGSIVHLKARWTPDDYLDSPPARRLHTKAAHNVWQPAHFAAEWALVVADLRQIAARHVIVATVPAVTIAPIARGWRGKSARGSRHYPYYVRPWVDDDEFDVHRDEHLTERDARLIDSAIDAYNETIIASVRQARRDGLDWYLLDLGALLDSMATKRYLEDPAARPPWWEPYQLPPELEALEPVPNTRFFASGPGGRTQGGLFSLDGVRPTTIGYGIVAREVARLMDRVAGVEFRTPTGDVRPPVEVDFDRVVASDSLITRPPRIIFSTVLLLGWLDEAVDWVDRLLPFR